MTQRKEMQTARYSPDKGERLSGGPFALGAGVPITSRGRQLLLANALRRPGKKTPPGDSLKTQEKSSASPQAELAVENEESSNPELTPEQFEPIKRYLLDPAHVARANEAARESIKIVDGTVPPDYTPEAT